MNNEDFFDMLAEIDDTLISDAACVPTKPKMTALIVKRIMFIAAAVAIFIISASFLRDMIKTGNTGIFDVTPDNGITSAPGYEIQESTAENFSEDTVTNAFVPPQESTTESFSGETVTNAFIPPQESTEEAEKTTSSEPSDIPTAAEPSTDESPADEPSAYEPTTKDGKPGSVLPPWDLPDIFFPSMGDTNDMTTGLFYIETPAVIFAEALPDDSFDREKFTDKQSVSWETLEEIYKTDILPGYIPVEEPSGPTLDSIPQASVKDTEHTVYYNENRTEAYSSQEFSFDTKDGSTLTVKVSTESFPLYAAEKRHMGSKSLINDTPVLLISGKILTKTVVLNAYFEKDGSYFRIQQKGKDLSEDEFTKILQTIA